MPVYYLEDNLTVNNLLLPKRSVQTLKNVSEGKRKTLIELGLIRELSMPPYSVLEGLRKYATILDKAGIKDLGDFAFADLGELKTRIRGAKEDLEKLQSQAKEMIKPENPLLLEDCGCGESPSSIPKAKE